MGRKNGSNKHTGKLAWQKKAAAELVSRKQVAERLGMAENSVSAGRLRVSSNQAEVSSTTPRG